MARRGEEEDAEDPGGKAEEENVFGKKTNCIRASCLLLPSCLLIL